MSSFLLLCERAGTAYPINDFITQASAVLGQIKKDWLSNHALSPNHSANALAASEEKSPFRGRFTMEVAVHTILSQPLASWSMDAPPGFSR
jgi:hypothetical protein